MTTERPSPYEQVIQRFQTHPETIDVRAVAQHCAPACDRLRGGVHHACMECIRQVAAKAEQGFHNHPETH